MELFRLQKYKKFESNSQPQRCSASVLHVVSTAKVQKIWEQFTTDFIMKVKQVQLFRLQKCKKFESNSQQMIVHAPLKDRCFDCKSTKNLRAFHNSQNTKYSPPWVVSTVKVQKIWEQFTTDLYDVHEYNELFRLQKYKKFESNSQPRYGVRLDFSSCFDCKSTKNLRAIHNLYSRRATRALVVSTAKVQKIWEQFTTENGSKLSA